MAFIPAGDLIGLAHQVRTVRLRQNGQLPGGNYRFIDTHCTDPGCDCRKTMILVYRDDVHVSTINFGWEPAAFYQAWMGAASEDDLAISMSGASIDITSPDGVPPREMLALFHALLDEAWIAKFKLHYTGVKAKVAEIEKQKSARNRL